MIWLITIYMWLFIHRPYEVWPRLGELHIAWWYMLATILYWAFFSAKTWNSNRLNLAFLCLAISILASNFLSPFDPGLNMTVDTWLKMGVFYVLVISTVRDEKQLKILVAGFLAAMAIYVAHSFYEFLCGRYEYRMGVARMIGVDITMNNPNAFGATVLYSLPMIYPLWYEARKRWQKFSLIAYVLLACGCILLTGSRSSLVGLVILSILSVSLSKHRFTFAIGLVITLPLIWIGLREDLKNRYLTLIDPSVGPANAQASAEGRVRGFNDGIELWKKYPLTGVGPECHAIASGGGYQAHNLYGQVLGELGTLGGLSLMFIVACFALNTWEMRTLVSERGADYSFSARLIVAVFLTVLLLLVLGWGGHNLYRFTWLWYGAFQAIAVNCLKRQALPDWSNSEDAAMDRPLEFA
jgi:O-antigen ligase